MDFYINDEKIDITLEEEKTVGDVLKSFEITCEENETAVIGIKINGTQITAESFDGYAEKELDDSMKFEFSIVTKQNIKDAFKNLAELFIKLSEKMQTISVELQSGKQRKRTNQFWPLRTASMNSATSRHLQPFSRITQKLKLKINRSLNFSGIFRQCFQILNLP
ncbi:MAG: hypothetical protein L6V86_04280 [Treponema sp.]|nr:MAG: hypothetical protein L6V86_04280 [Treponema sp.]